jgi:hypothetical protein
MFRRIQHSTAFSEDSAFSYWYIELNPRLYVSLSELRESIVYYFINVQQGIINNSVPGNNRYDVFYEKYTLIKTSFHGVVLYVAFIFTLLVLFWTRTPHFPSIPPISPNCYLPKSGRHVTSLDQALSSSEARSGKSLGTRLLTSLCFNFLH